MIKEYKLTLKGKETFEKELDFLKTTKRDEIAEKIGADCVCAIGTRFTLYKESKKHKQYSLMIKTL